MFWNVSDAGGQGVGKENKLIIGADKTSSKQRIPQTNTTHTENETDTGLN